MTVSVIPVVAQLVLRRDCRSVIVYDLHPHRREVWRMTDYYCEHGFEGQLLPLIPGGKQPVLGVRFRKHWQFVRADRGRTRMTSDRLQDYYFKRPWCNLGLLTGVRSGIVVIDIDRPKTGDSEALHRFEYVMEQVRRGRPLPGIGPTDTTCYFTPRGVHLMYRSPCAMKGINALALKKLGLPVDVKANGGYVVVPPSVTAGYRRTFFRDFGLLKQLPTDSEVVEKTRCPEQKSDSLKITRQRTELDMHARGYPCAHYIAKLDVPEGKRNDALFALYNILLRTDNEPEFARAKVREVNAHFSEPLPLAEVAKCYRKQYKLSCSKIRSLVPDVEKVCAGCERANNLLKTRTALHPTLIRKLVSEGLIAATAGTLILVATEQSDGASDAARFLGVAPTGIHKFFRKLKQAGLDYLLRPLGQSHRVQP